MVDGLLIIGARWLMPAGLTGGRRVTKKILLTPTSFGGRGIDTVSSRVGLGSRTTCGTALIRLSCARVM